MKRQPVWILKEALLAMHEESLAQFGGAEGLRDVGLLESALGRPENKFHYEGEARVPWLASAYCFGIARNHPFLDGNKRAGFLAATVFLLLNGLALEVDPIVAEIAVLDLVGGQMSEDQFGSWIADHSEAL